MFFAAGVVTVYKTINDINLEFVEDLCVLVQRFPSLLPLCTEVFDIVCCDSLVREDSTTSGTSHLLEYLSLTWQRVKHSQVRVFEAVDFGTYIAFRFHCLMGAGTYNARDFDGFSCVVGKTATVTRRDSVLFLTAETHGIHRLASTSNHPLNKKGLISHLSPFMECSELN